MEERNAPHFDTGPRTRGQEEAKTREWRDLPVSREPSRRVYSQSVRDTKKFSGSNHRCAWPHGVARSEPFDETPVRSAAQIRVYRRRKRMPAITLAVKPYQAITVTSSSNGKSRDGCAQYTMLTSSLSVKTYRHTK